MADKNVDRPVVVRLSSGLEVGLKSPAFAREIYPGGEIVRYQDGGAYDADADGGGSADVVNPAKMKRADLDAYAETLGIKDPAGTYNKIDDLRAAVEPLHAAAIGAKANQANAAGSGAADSAQGADMAPDANTADTAGTGAPGATGGDA